MKKILILENGNSISKIIGNMFKEEYEILPTDPYLGKDSMMPKQIPTLIIADLTTIKKEKVELLMKLKSHPVISMVPFLMINTTYETGISDQFSNMNYYLNKPFTRDALLSSVIKIVKHSDSLSPW